MVRRQRLIKERCQKAKKAAVDRVARLIDGELPGATATIARVVDLFRREVLPKQGTKQQVETRRVLELWTNVLGGQFLLNFASWDRVHP